MSKYYKRLKTKMPKYRHVRTPNPNSNPKSVGGVAEAGINFFSDLFHSAFSGIKSVVSSFFNMFTGTIVSGIKSVFSLMVDSIFGFTKQPTKAKAFSSSSSKGSKKSGVKKKDITLETDFSSQALVYLKTMAGELIKQTFVHLAQGKQITSVAAALGTEHAKTMVDQVTSRLSKDLVAEVAHYLATSPTAAPMRKLSAHLLHKASSEIIKGIESGDLLRKFSEALAKPAVAPTRVHSTSSIRKLAKPAVVKVAQEDAVDAPVTGFEAVAVDVMKKVATGLVQDAANTFVSGTADKVSRGCGWLYSGARSMLTTTYGAACSAANAAMAYAKATVEEPEVVEAVIPVEKAAIGARP